jgi:hypothetical protein
MYRKLEAETLNGILPLCFRHERTETLTYAHPDPIVVLLVLR